MSRIILLAKIMIFLLCTFLISSCTTSSPTQLSLVTPTAIIVSSPTVTARLIPTSQPLPSPTPSPIPDAAILRSQMQTLIKVNPVNGLNSYPLQGITGWSRGVEVYSDCHYQWLGNDHLLLSPIARDWGFAKDTLPAVVDVASGVIWLPETDDANSGCLALWSDNLRNLVSLHDRKITFYNLDGNIIRQIVGDVPLDLSPSGLRLWSGFIWRDLKTAQTVEFSGQLKTQLYYPAWSANEKQLFFVLGTQFALADTDKHTLTSLLEGSLVSADMEGVPVVQWVLNNTHLTILWKFFDAKTNNLVIPLIDPTAGTYIDILAVTKLNAVGSCDTVGYVAPNGEDIWISCDNNSYEISLRTLVTRMLSEGYVPFSWSADSRYLLIAEKRSLAYSLRLGQYSLFSVNSGKSFSLSDNRVVAPTWNPDGKRLAYLSEDGRNLVVLNPSTRFTTQISLAQSSVNVFWRPQGDGLAVQSSDGSLWYTSYPFTDQVEQLTPPLPKAEAVKWSPDGDRIAFVSEPDVYIVSVTQP